MRPNPGEYASGALASSMLKQTKLAQRLVDEGKGIREIAEIFNVHVATIYRLSPTGA